MRSPEIKERVRKCDLREMIPGDMFTLFDTVSVVGILAGDRRQSSVLYAVSYVYLVLSSRESLDHYIPQCSIGRELYLMCTGGRSWNKRMMLLRVLV